MKRLKTYFFIFLPAVCLTFALFIPCAFAAQKNTQTGAVQVFNRAGNSVVVVKAETKLGISQGSAVAYLNGCSVILNRVQYKDASRKTCIPGSTWFFTNAHVVGDAQSVDIYANGESFKAQVRYRDSEYDIALLHSEMAVVPVVDIAKDKTYPVGTKVYAIGAPKGLERTLTEGVISGFRGGRLIQTSAPISAGSSGGGLFDDDGRLLGITTFKIKDGEALNFSISINDYKKWMSAISSADIIFFFFEQYDFEFRVEFAKWSTRQDQSEVYYYDLINQVFEDVAFDRLSEEEGVKRFEGFLAEFQRQKISIKADPVQRGDILRLVCSESLVSDQRLVYVRSYVVHLVEKTVNGWPAKITESSISWVIDRGVKDPKIFYIDRFIGRISIGIKSRPDIASGPCKVGSLSAVF